MVHAVTWGQQFFFAQAVHVLSPITGVQAPPVELEDDAALDELDEPVVAPEHAPAQGPLFVVHWPIVSVAWSGLPHMPKQAPTLPPFCVRQDPQQAQF